MRIRIRNPGPNYSVFLPYQLIQSSFLFLFIFVCRFHPDFLSVFFFKYLTLCEGTTHDSVEDAVTSLRLYKKHLELKKENRFQEAVSRMYDLGKELNWKVPES
jgi:hypothetical protein